MLDSKNKVKETILNYFDNDSRITDELLFNGKEILDYGFQLLRETTRTKDDDNDYEYNDVFCQVYLYNLIKILGVDYPLQEYDTTKHQYIWKYKGEIIDNERKTELITESYNNIQSLIEQKLNDFVGDDGCWYYEGYGKNNQRNTYGTLYLFSANNLALDFFNDDTDKVNYIFS